MFFFKESEHPSCSCSSPGPLSSSNVLWDPCTSREETAAVTSLWMFAGGGRAVEKNKTAARRLTPEESLRGLICEEPKQDVAPPGRNEKTLRSAAVQISWVYVIHTI